jgi:hypothetical protein
MKHEGLTRHYDLVCSIRVPDHCSTPANVAAGVRLDLLGGGSEFATAAGGLLSKQVESLDASEPLLRSSADESQPWAAHDVTLEELGITVRQRTEATDDQFS